MKYHNRRIFIKQTSLAIAAAALNPDNVFAFSAFNKPKLSFSTLGCPKWSLPDIVKFAKDHHYQGIEIRTIMGEMNLYKCPEFSPANIEGTKRLIASNGLKISDLGCSSTLHERDKMIRKKNLDEARLFIELAAKLEVPYIRVFPDKLPLDDTRKPTLDLIVDGLLELGNYSKGSGVKVLIESHGDLIKTEELLYVMKNSENDGVGMVWDIFNMWSNTRETPAFAYSKLKKYIRHVHVKDGVFIAGKEKYVLLGEGQAPIKEAVQLLYHNNFPGYYSFEWEKVWHPEIAEPEIALAQYPIAINKFFK